MRVTQKGVVSVLVIALIVCPVGGFAQTAAVPQPTQPAVSARSAQLAVLKEWRALMKKQMEARKVFNGQLKAERDAFLKDHPEIAGHVESQQKKARALAQARKAALMAQAAQKPPEQATPPANQ